MKKAAFVILSLAFVVAILSPVTGTADTEGPYTFTVSGAEEAYITAVDKSYSGLLSITNELGGYPVIAIGVEAFSDCTSLTCVTIPSSVTGIGYGAFVNCTNLISVTIPASVTSIGDGAFAHCTSLTNATIPNSVIAIGSFAFQSCASLNSVTLPPSVTHIGKGAFDNCVSLTSVTLPPSVTHIGAWTFNDCNNLTRVYFLGLPPKEEIEVFSNTPATLYYLPAHADHWPKTYAGRPTAVWQRQAP